MIFISHRGNIDGPIPERENSPDYIDEAIKFGVDVECDVRYDNGFWLGHDERQYKVDESWLLKRSQHLWLHAKDFESLKLLARHRSYYRVFWHQNDNFSLVGMHHIWCHGQTDNLKSECIIPLLSKDEVINCNYSGFGGVCSDYILDCKRKFHD
jgi:hypothetical protein